MAKTGKYFELEILELLKANTLLSSKEVHSHFTETVSYTTVKRILQVLIAENLIVSIGKGKGTKYELSQSYNLSHPIDVEEYFKYEVDEREIKNDFSFSLISDALSSISIFTKEELIFLDTLQHNYSENISKLTKAEYSKELERLAIDLSWKSSQIEGNTYSLLETERLLKEKKTAFGKSKDEAIMLLNHKETIDFIIENPTYINPLSLARIEDIHSMLIKELDVDRNIRNRRVGISGTNYKPLDNSFQIKEAIDDMCNLINKQQHVFSKAFLALILLSYIQAFADGNKRTARIISNAILMNHKYCPISFRTVDAIEYKKALLVFYEQNNMHPFKKIFIQQFEFAVNTYF